MTGRAEALWNGERTCFAGVIDDVTKVILHADKFEEPMGTPAFLAIK